MGQKPRVKKCVGSLLKLRGMGIDINSSMVSVGRLDEKNAERKYFLYSLEFTRFADKKFKKSIFTRKYFIVITLSI